MKYVHEIILNKTCFLNETEIKFLPTEKAMKNQIRSVRNENMSYFKPVFKRNPSLFAKKSKKIEILCFGTVINDSNRIIVFISEFELDILNNVNTMLKKWNF